MTSRAVIFDLWNTLIPFDHELERRELVAIADAFGVAPGEFKREWRSGYERRLVSDLRGSFDRVCRSLGVTRAGAVDEAFRLRIEMHREMFVPREDAVATLKELHARGYLTGLLTNCSSEVPELVAESPLAGLFDVEIYSCSVGLRKPERAIYELAANGLRVEPRLCLYIGDGGDDELSGARAFGMTAVLLKPGDTQPPEEWEGPEITRLAQVLELLGERPRNRP
jgi:putative hydrolase of the HAD superfamily